MLIWEGPLNPNDLILEAAVGTAPQSKITADLPDDRPTAEQGRHGAEARRAQRR
jgi:hypothetical protein